MMDFRELNDFMAHHSVLTPESKALEAMHFYSYEALRLCAEFNTGYHGPKESKKILEELFGKPVSEGMRIAPPFYTDYGKRTTIGKNVFINCACQFQDQGGVEIGDNSLIGPKVVIATINHGFAPDERGILNLGSVKIGRNVWIGASAVILPGVTIGDNSIIAAGAIVNKDIPENVVAGGVPVRVIKNLE